MQIQIFALIRTKYLICLFSCCKTVTLCLNSGQHAASKPNPSRWFSTCSTTLITLTSVCHLEKSGSSLPGSTGSHHGSDLCDCEGKKTTAAKHLQRSRLLVCSNVLRARPSLLTGAVGTRSHLQQLAGVINDVALNFGDHRFWELLFILWWSIMGAVEGERARDRGCPLSAALKGGEKQPPD